MKLIGDAWTEFDLQSDDEGKVSNSAVVVVLLLRKAYLNLALY